LVTEARPPPSGAAASPTAIVSLYCLRVYLKRSYREALDPPSEMFYTL
jgi:hypothetical protein